MLHGCYAQTFAWYAQTFEWNPSSMSGGATHFVWLPATWQVRMVLQLLECLVLLPNQEALTNGADIRLQEQCWNSYMQWLCHDLLL